MSYHQVTSEVAAGIELLDGMWPRWECEIDLDRLRLSDGERCVLGQLYGEYTDALRELGFDDDDAINYGFDIPGPPWDSIDMRYDFLTEQWRAVIADRRARRKC